MQLLFSRRFGKRYDKLSYKIKEKFKKKVAKLTTNGESDYSLRIHPLQGKRSGYMSMNVTGDIRAIFQYIDDDTIIFADIGSHSELYE